MLRLRINGQYEVNEQVNVKTWMTVNSYINVQNIQHKTVSCN